MGLVWISTIFTIHMCILFNRIVHATSQTTGLMRFGLINESKILTLFYCKHTHMQCLSKYEESHEFLTFTDFAMHFV